MTNYTIENNTDKQLEQLQKLLVYLDTHSAFYKTLFLRNNIKIKDILSLTDLVKLPVTIKDDLQNANWDFLCVDRHKIAEYCSTSGTLGMPVTIALTEKDIVRLAENEYTSFITAGGNSNDIFHLMLTLDRQFMAGIAYYSGIRRLGAGVVRVGPGNPAMQIDAIQRLNPTVLVSAPSFMVNVINYAKFKNINFNNLSVKKIICIGENIRNKDFSLNSLGRKITDEWNVSLFSTYASTEMQTAFTECEYGKGGHHNPDLLIFEILDDNNNPLPAGEFGELTITTLDVEGMPLLRYKTGDICTFYDTPCECGRNTLRISPIIGRKQQLIKYNATTLYPQTIFNILNDISEVMDYTIELTKNDLGLDDILINIAVQDLNENADKKIKQLLQSALRVSPKIQYLPLTTIQNLQIQEGKRKPSKLIDKR